MHRKSRVQQQDDMAVRSSLTCLRWAAGSVVRDSSEELEGRVRSGSMGNKAGGRGCAVAMQVECCSAPSALSPLEGVGPSGPQNLADVDDLSFA